MKNIVIILLIGGVISCGDSSYERPTKYVDSNRCACPIQSKMSESIDSTNNIYGTKNKGKIGGELQVPIALKKLITAEVSLGYERENSETKTRTLILKAKDYFPDITDYSNFKKEFYCAYIEIICENTNITDAELEEIKSTKLIEIEKIVDELYISRLKPIAYEKPSTKIVRPIIKESKSTFSIDYILPQTNDLISVKNKFLRTSIKQCLEDEKLNEIRIVIKSSRGFNKKSGERFDYSGGDLMICINDECIEVGLLGSLSINDISTIQNRLKNAMDTIVTKNIDTICLQLKEQLK